jgi:hypothetical protein
MEAAGAVESVIWAGPLVRRSDARCDGSSERMLEHAR